MTNWIDACATGDIEAEGVIRFDNAGRTFAIYHGPNGDFFCTDGLCSHEAIHLSDGLVMDYEIECPKHSGVFDIRTGHAKRLPACVDLRTYPVRIEGDRIFIGL